MKKYVLTGGGFALFALVLGAFATHALKAHFSAEVLQSFQTGTRYMMYHGWHLLFFQKSHGQEIQLFTGFFFGALYFFPAVFS